MFRISTWAPNSSPLHKYKWAKLSRGNLSNLVRVNNINSNYSSIRHKMDSEGSRWPMKMVLNGSKSSLTTPNICNLRLTVFTNLRVGEWIFVGDLVTKIR